MAKEYKAYLEEKLATATADDPEMGFYRRAHLEVTHHLQRTEPEPPDRPMRILLVTRKRDSIFPRQRPEEEIKEVDGAVVHSLDGNKVNSDLVLRRLKMAKKEGRAYDLLVTGENYAGDEFYLGHGGIRVLNQAHDQSLVRSVVIIDDYRSSRPGIPREDWSWRGISDWILSPNETSDILAVIEQSVQALRPQPLVPQPTAQ